jgi:hypothetical protein
MRMASTVLDEFIARAFPYRQEPNRRYARTMFSLAACDEDHYAEDDFQHAGEDALRGRGCQEPLLGMPAFRKRSKPE